MKGAIENFYYFRDDMVEQFYSKIRTVEELLNSKGLDNRINQIIDIKDYPSDLVICFRIGYTNEFMKSELILCYGDSGEITINELGEDDIISPIEVRDLIYCDYEDIFENLDFALEEIIKNANEGLLYLNYEYNSF